MTPQERKLVDDLFDRLARLETSPREAEAEAAVADGLRRAPHASYALVQTVLVQDEALRRANARIQELEGGEIEQRPAGGFLDSMRDALLGPSQSRGSVPTVPPGNGGQRGPVWNSGQVFNQNDQRMAGDPRQGNPQANPGGFGGGGSFLGTAAAAAAGMIGGSLLMNSIGGLMGGGHKQSFGDTTGAGGSKSPWDGNSSGGDLARDAGVNDIGKNSSADSGQRQGAFDQAQADADQDSDQDQDDDDDFDVGGLDSGDSDFA